jgi:hypothetical protein
MRISIDTGFQWRPPDVIDRHRLDWTDRGAWAGKECPSMKTVNAFLVRAPVLLTIAAVAIALVAAACSPGGTAAPGY